VGTYLLVALGATAAADAGSLVAVVHQARGVRGVPARRHGAFRPALGGLARCVRVGTITALITCVALPVSGWRAEPTSCHSTADSTCWAGSRCSQSFATLAVRVETTAGTG